MGSFGLLAIIITVLILAVRWGSWLFVAIAVFMLIGMYNEEQTKPSEAQRYRAAQRAVAEATGRPCDYACKAAIADQARPKAADPAPTSSL